ncbi:hypothetical protein C8J56DRAFT_1019262 [Mycena floridula]|nr:hypothetical protein C8J56DRAFT_1019262 [Mycena floridula]
MVNTIQVICMALVASSTMAIPIAPEAAGDLEARFGFGSLFKLAKPLVKTVAKPVTNELLSSRDVSEVEARDLEARFFGSLFKLVAKPLVKTIAKDKLKDKLSSRDVSEIEARDLERRFGFGSLFKFIAKPIVKTIAKDKLSSRDILEIDTRDVPEISTRDEDALESRDEDLESRDEQDLESRGEQDHDLEARFGFSSLFKLAKPLVKTVAKPVAKELLSDSNNQRCTGTLTGSGSRQMLVTGGWEFHDDMKSLTQWLLNLSQFFAGLLWWNCVTNVSRASNVLVEAYLAQWESAIGYPAIATPESEPPLVDFQDLLSLPGKGVLVKNGTYYYPACIIGLPNKMHKGNTSGNPGEPMMVPDDDVDELWRDHLGRRKIRRLLCLHSFLNPDLEHSNKHHKRVGHKWWQEALLFLEDLSIKDCAGINNWFASIPAIKERNIDWLESLAICHARTLLIMARKRPEFLCEPDCPVIEAGEEEKLYRFLLIDKSWWEQERLHSPGTLCIVHVIWESVQDLEERMFEYSDAAGWARNYQWGRDAGTHQNNWDPYITIHPQGEYKAYVEGESDMELGKDFLDDQPYPKLVKQVVGPKPRAARKAAK